MRPMDELESWKTRMLTGKSLKKEAQKAALEAKEKASLSRRSTPGGEGSSSREQYAALMAAAQLARSVFVGATASQQGPTKTCSYFARCIWDLIVVGTYRHLDCLYVAVQCEGGHLTAASLG